MLPAAVAVFHKPDHLCPTNPDRRFCPAFGLCLSLSEAGRNPATALFTISRSFFHGIGNFHHMGFVTYTVTHTMENIIKIFVLHIIQMIITSGLAAQSIIGKIMMVQVCIVSCAGQFHSITNTIEEEAPCRCLSKE